MNFTYTAFAKAAKRLAETDDLKLSQAQEKLAWVLGFKNHHAAQQALAAPASEVDGYVGRRWRGLTWMQVFELLTLGGRFEKGENWGLRAMDLLRMVSVDIFSKPSDDPVTATEISEGLGIIAILQRAKELRERAKPEELARHHALLTYAGGIRTGTGGRFAGEPTAESSDQHGYLTAQIAPALSTLFLMESANASDEQVVAFYSAVKDDPANIVQQILVLEARSRFAVRPRVEAAA